MSRQEDLFTQDNSLQELEYQSYQLGLLNEYIRELNSLENQEEVAQRFLLMCMGAVGADKCLLLILGPNREPAVYSRGFSQSGMQVLHKNAPAVEHRYFSRMNSGPDILPKQVRLVYSGMHGPPPDNDLPWPKDTAVLLQWTLDAQCYGFLALGPKLSRESYNARETDFLLQLTEILMDSLRLVCSRAAVERLNADLVQKNQELSQALAQAEENRESLDRQIFHFKALSETSRELSGILDKQKLLDAFALMVQGSLSSRSVCVLLYETENEKKLYSYQGPDRPELDGLPHAAVKEFIASFYPSESHYSQPGYKMQLVENGRAHANRLKLPLELGAVFSLDSRTFGLICVSSSFKDQEYSEDEENLLGSLTYNFLLSLSNVYSFETIQELNFDLGRRNFELSRTIEELRQSKETINFLQKTKNRLQELIHTEAVRLERVKLWDFVIILAVTLLISLPYNTTSPGGVNLTPLTWTIPAPETIDTDWAGMKHDSETAVFVDARPREFYEQEKIKGAINLPLNLFDFVYMMNFAHMDQEKELIVYGRNISRRYDEQVAHELRERGHEQVMVMPGGLNEWKNKGLPVEP